jgi:hypothetical protein
MTLPRYLRLSCHVFAGLLLLGASSALAAGVTHQVTVINGLQVDQYSWPDSSGLTRTVSLKQEGNGNPGHGGYAIQMTYQLNNQTITVNADSGSDGGFGYFVSHERFRNFTDNTSDTIASKIFGQDDSPLGSGFPVVGRPLVLGDPNAAAHRFTMTYGHYGTTFPIPKDANGNDVQLTPTDPAKFAFYSIPITITWVFQGGTDYPRIDTAVDFSGIPGPDLVNFDVRGPYGVMVFDNGNNATVDGLMWGDRFHFVTTKNPPTRNSSWVWNEPNSGARYSALTAGGFEMGLFEPVPFASSATDDPFADERGSTSTAYNAGNGCKFGEVQLLPCDFEWPYQSIQYSLPPPPDNNTTTNFKKMAWGSTVFYGTGPSLPKVFDTSQTTEAFNGFPDNRVLTYRICVVLGATTPAGLTKTAAGQPSKNCASEVVLAKQLCCGDFNGDHKADILWRNTDGTLYTLLMNGLSVIGTGSPGMPSNDLQVAGIGDFDGDGKADILLRNNSGELDMWLMNGTSISSQRSFGVIPNDWQVAGIGDFNGDGKADILWRNTNGELYILMMNGFNLIGSGSPGTLTPDWQVAGIGDFNGDGKADILLRNSSGELEMWLMNGTSIGSQRSFGVIPNDWQVAGIGDFNGDGKADILWRNSISGQVYILLMNGFSLVGQGSPGALSNDWQVAGIGDFNGDGNADIFWRSDSGKLDMWLMNGTSISSQSSLGAISNNWQIE